ncbi:MAG: alanine racemase [Clostridia bacterium]
MNLSSLDTPSYIFDLDILQKRAKYLQDKISPVATLCYAMKANSFIVKALETIVDRFEVCSPGEFCICENEKLPMEKLVISGVYKNEADVERMLKCYDNIGTYTAESKEQFMLINKYAKKYNRKVKMLLRLSSGNQFGMDKTDITEIIKDRASFDNIEIVGIQFFSGTQKNSIKRLTRELNSLDEFIKTLKDECDFSSQELEFGTGFPISYFTDDKPFDEDAFLDDFFEILNKMTFKGKITLEVGRSIAASCGTYLTKVCDVKTNSNQNYCIVDGGIHHMNYYGQVMAMRVPKFQHFNKEGNDKKLWNICGALCTSNDVLLKQIELTNLQKGDKIAFYNTGAYSTNEGIALLLSRDLPSVYFMTEGGFKCVRKNISTYPLNSPNYIK